MDHHWLVVDVVSCVFVAELQPVLPYEVVRDPNPVPEREAELVDLAPCREPEERSGRDLPPYRGHLPRVQCRQVEELGRTIKKVGDRRLLLGAGVPDLYVQEVAVVSSLGREVILQP